MNFHMPRHLARLVLFNLLIVGACVPGVAVVAAIADDGDKQDRLDELEARVLELEALATDQAAQLDALEDVVAATALEAGDALVNAEAAQERVSAVEERLDEIESWRDEFMDEWETSDLVGRVASLEERMDAVEGP